MDRWVGEKPFVGFLIREVKFLSHPLALPGEYHSDVLFHHFTCVLCTKTSSRKEME